jgi:hypothetical protein
LMVQWSIHRSFLPPRPQPCIRGVPVVRRSRPHAGVLAFNGSMHKDGHRAPARNRRPTGSEAGRTIFRSGGERVAPPGGFRPSRSGPRRTSETTVQIVRELPGGGWSTGFIAIRTRGAKTDLASTRCAGTTKNPRQTFRPTGGSLNPESLFTCALPVRMAGRLATYHPQVFSRVYCICRQPLFAGASAVNPVPANEYESNRQYPPVPTRVFVFSNLAAGCDIEFIFP